MGHQRDAQTKGVWVWGEPIEVVSGKEKISLLYVDTEGFEGTGQADVYDDRIFALSVLVSSTLVYNLPETVKESDIEKLSFASQLAEEFYQRQQGRGSTLQLATLLWLIQRDFLEGKTVKQLVDQALAEVPNVSDDKHVDSVNKVRQSLLKMGQKNEAFGLKQPHLERTKLCELPDSAFDPTYLRQREQLRELVVAITKPKKMGSSFLNGANFADFFEKAVTAINAGDIPSPSSIIESFNAGIVETSMQIHSDALSQLPLPITDVELQHAQERAVMLAKEHLHHQSFGDTVSDAYLAKKLNAAFELVKERNRMRSKELCEKLQIECSDGLERTVMGMREHAYPCISMHMSRPALRGN